MATGEVLDDFVGGFRARKYSAALLVAFIDLLNDLEAPAMQLGSFQGLLEVFPQRMTLANGQPAATLILERSRNDTVSLRRHYDLAQLFFRETNKRYDFPTLAPYGSGKWRDYMRWWDALSSFNVEQLAELRAAVINHVLAELPSQAFDPSSIRAKPPLFRLAIESFELNARRGEPTGAAFQGLMFGYLRADNPHLQVDIDKVRVGSKRIGRAADIDCWDGRLLAVSAEVKQYTLNHQAALEMGDFATRAKNYGAIGIVAALGFQEGVRDALLDEGVVPVDVHDLLGAVSLWDSVKQGNAIKAMEYYYDHIEQNSPLTSRFERFLKESALPTEPPHAEESASNASVIEYGQEAAQRRT